jgi:hypothetical protein
MGKTMDTETLGRRARTVAGYKRPQIACLVHLVANAKNLFRFRSSSGAVPIKPFRNCGRSCKLVMRTQEGSESALKPNTAAKCQEHLGTGFFSTTEDLWKTTEGKYGRTRLYITNFLNNSRCRMHV